MRVFSPREQAVKKLESYGFKIDSLYNQPTKKFNRRELVKLKPVDYKLYKYFLDLIKWLDVKRREDKTFDVKSNLKRMAVNRVAVDLSQSVKKEIKNEKETVIVKVIPSSAKEPDPEHQRQYGKTMTLERALQLGITTRFGCQCELMILSSTADFDEVVEKVKIEVSK